MKNNTPSNSIVTWSDDSITIMNEFEKASEDLFFRWCSVYKEPFHKGCSFSSSIKECVCVDCQTSLDKINPSKK